MLTDGGGGSLLSTDPAAKAARGSAVNSSAVVPVSTTVRRVTSNVSCSSGAVLGSCSSMMAPCLHSQQETQAYGLLLFRCLGRHRGLRPDVVWDVDDNGRRCAAYDNPSKRFQFRGIDFHVEQESRNMNEVAGLPVRYEFTSCTPANLADAGQHISDRLLFSMMVNSGPRSRFNLEQAAPDGRSNAQRRCDSLATFGARRLCGAQIEFSRADDVDCSKRAHGVPDQFGSSTGKLRSGGMEGH